MKKLLIMSFASILLLTGCGATETMSCSYVTNANNGTAKIKYDIDHQNNEIKKVRISYDYNFDTDNAGNNGTTDVDDTNTGNNARIGGDNTTGNTNDNDNMTNNNGNNNNNITNGNNNETTNDNNITTYNNNTNNNDDNNNDNNDKVDGVGTGTDGTTNDSQIDDDGIVDGVVGSVIDSIVGGVAGIILDSAGLRDRHQIVQNTYGNISGFSVQNTNDANNNYTVTYVIDYDTISDDDLATFNLTRDLDEMRDNYVDQGFTCK